MTRLEDGSILSMGDAKSGECGVCGKRLNFKDEKVNDVQSTVARHCGKIYTLSQSTSTSVAVSRDPKYVEKENKIAEKQAKANKLRAQGKTDEAIKLEEDVQEEYQKLNEDDGGKDASEEPKSSFNPRAESSREEEKRGRR